MRLQQQAEKLLHPAASTYRANGCFERVGTRSSWNSTVATISLDIAQNRWAAHLAAREPGPTTKTPRVEAGRRVRSAPVTAGAGTLLSDHAGGRDGLPRGSV